jgi:hypothetical protein
MTLAIPKDLRSISFTELSLVELNDTDGDLGLHASIDGEPWTILEIDGPVPGKLLHIFARGRLRPGDAVVALAFGPGLTLYAGLLRAT